MKLYHGSDVEIAHIVLQELRAPKDFGQGFYLSNDLQQARNFARYRADKPKSKTHAPITTQFDFDESFLIDGNLRVKRFDGYTLEWIQFIKANRKRRNKDYDVVIGPIANDDVKTQFVKHMMGEITEAELMESLKWKRCTFQYCFITEKAVSLLKPAGII